MLELRILNPETELDLFQEAFAWRSAPKKHLRINRMSFEQFSGSYDNQVVFGLFNDQLWAVYMFIETAPKVVESHFTSRRDAPTEDVFAGAKTLLKWFEAEGSQVTACIVERNRPLRRFAEALGFEPVDEFLVGNRTVLNYVYPPKTFKSAQGGGDIFD